MAAAVPARPSLLDRLASTSHAWVAAASVVLVVLMIVPVPPWVLDMLLSVNITLALVILLVTLYTENALSFSVFPTLLLIVTLFRLSLNITGTRSILLHGYAGQVIEAFGNVVVGGNYAVGIVIFAILIIIQFVVITNGAGRVAEVAARFTLDAMPGKQLAVDADLNAGPHHRSRGAPAPQGHPARRRLLRRDGRCVQVRARRRDRGRDHRVREHHRRLRRRHAPIEAADRRSAAAVHAADDRRRHRHADPGAAHLDGDRHHRHPCRVRRLVRARPHAPARARTARARDRRRTADPVRDVRAAAAVHAADGGGADRARDTAGASSRRPRPPRAVPARRASRASPARPASPARRRRPRSSPRSPSCRCCRTIRWSSRSASA